MVLPFIHRRCLFVLCFFLLLCLFFCLSTAFSQDSVDELRKEDSVGSMDLGRRGKVTLDNLDIDAVRNNGNYYGLALSIDSTGLGLFDAFFACLSMIIVSEIGDETFLIAALMAMRHPKSIVLSGALTALIIMTVLSTGLGRIVPNLISRKHPNSAATDSKSLQKKEIEEVKEKLEAGQGKTSFRRIFSRFCRPIFLESFILTFLAEWGDRSQIATIALATHKNALGVAVGATIGHSLCISLAVVGGSMLAFQDLTAHRCHRGRPALSWLFHIFLFLPSSSSNADRSGFLRVLSVYLDSRNCA